MEETEIAGLASDQQTFLCANVIGSNIVQVRERESLTPHSLAL